MLFMPVNPLGESHLTHLSTSQQVLRHPAEKRGSICGFWTSIWPKKLNSGPGRNHLFFKLGPYDPYGYLEKHWVPLILGWLSTKDWSKSAVALVWDFGPSPCLNMFWRSHGTRWYQCTSSQYLPISQCHSRPRFAIPVPALHRSRNGWRGPPT
jgi:hypothetical protein